MARSKKQNAVKMTQVSISLPPELVEAIDKMAEEDNRTRSNFIANVLRTLAQESAQGATRAQEAAEDGR